MNNINYELIDITKNPPSKDLLMEAYNKLGEVKLLFNTRGKSYRELGSEIIKSMSLDEAINALAADGKLIKRPFLITKDFRTLVGFKEIDWKKFFFD
tara:strand:+ start:198 stop:488 length:291 start_codon:yes stop_codon:yes gene_type:complete